MVFREKTHSVAFFKYENVNNSFIQVFYKTEEEEKIGSRTSFLCLSHSFVRITNCRKCERLNLILFLFLPAIRLLARHRSMRCVRMCM